MYTFQPNLRSITRIFSADYAENRRIRKRYNEHFMEINVLAHSGDASSPGGNASQPRGTTNRSQTTNQPCTLRCLSLGGIHVSTGQWTTTERASLNNRSPQIRWQSLRIPHFIGTKQRKIDSSFFHLSTILSHFLSVLTSFTPPICYLNI